MRLSAIDGILKWTITQLAFKALLKELGVFIVCFERLLFRNKNQVLHNAYAFLWFRIVKRPNDVVRHTIQNSLLSPLQQFMPLSDYKTIEILQISEMKGK